MAANAELIQATRDPNLEATVFAQHSSELKREMCLDDSFGSLGQDAKTRALAKPNSSTAELFPFVDSGSQMNIPTSTPLLARSGVGSDGVC